MGHGKETPRQKMIGMMYLVLTAMLALNVSATVLDAFVLVDKGLSQTAKSFKSKNERLYAQMDKHYAVNPNKVGAWKTRTDEIRLKTGELIDHIQGLKLLTITAAEKETSPAIIILEEGKKDVDTKLIGKKGDANIGGRIFLGQEHNGEAYDLKRKIIEYREYMLSHVDVNSAELLFQSIQHILNTDDPHQVPGHAPHTWETTRFDHVPMVAIFPQLTKMQLDVLNVEAEVVSYLLSRVDASDFKVNKLDAVVIPNSNYVFLGNDFVAEIFLAASDTTQVPKIYIGNYETFKTPEGNEDFRMVGNFDEIPIVNGRGIYKQKATRVALSNKWGGLIEVTAPDGTKLRRPFKNEYEVAQPSLVISPVKMNKFYRGVENPVEISIAGVSAEKIIPVIDHGSIKRVAGNEFIVLPGNPNQCNISVSADVDGVKRNMGSKPFRVENVPDPIASVAGVTSKNPTKGELGSALNVQATMPPGFDFEMKFTIISFTVMGQPAGYVETAISRSLMITEEQKRLVNSIRSGQPVSFTNIQAVGPDGSTRNLNDLVFTIR